MSFDYDLVIIGSTPEGIYAAQKAALLQARVALVTQTDQEYLIPTSFIHHLSLNHITNYLTTFTNDPWGIWQDNRNLPEVSLQEIKNCGDLIQENINAEHSLENLAILGVDLIYGKGEFCRLPKQAFLVNNRQLRSRNYLLATGAKYSIPLEYQTGQFNCFTPQDLWQTEINLLPNSLIIIGNSLRTIELAQGLARLGKKITLGTTNQKILPGEIIEANRLFNAQLAADGIKLLVDSAVSQIKVIDNQHWVQIGDFALETEGIIFASELQPNIVGLNLEGVGVKSLKQGIIVNEKLQTTNKNIYACGELLGGNSLPHITQYEVDIALKNILAFPWFNRKYHYLPIVMLTQPSLARIGITRISTQLKSKDIYVVKKNFKSSLSAQITGMVTGWCQLIVKANGQILGCTIISDRAMELISIIAIMISHKIKLNPNPIQGLLQQEIPYVAPSYTEIFNQLTLDFQQQKLQRNQKLRLRLNTWFDWRR